MAAVTLLSTATFTTASGAKTVTATPAVGDLIVIVTAHTGNVAQIPPADDQGGAYELARTASKNTSADRLCIWVRSSVIPAAVSTVFTHNPGTTTGGGLAVLKITGMLRVGTGAVRQSAGESNATGSAATPSPTFIQAPLTSNPIIGALFNAVNPGGVPARAGWVWRADVGYNTPTSGLDVMSIDSGETNTVIAWGGTSTNHCDVVVEFDASAAPPLFQDDPWQEEVEDWYDTVDFLNTNQEPPFLDEGWDWSLEEAPALFLVDSYQQADATASPSLIESAEWDWSEEAPSQTFVDSYQQKNFVPLVGPPQDVDFYIFDVEVEEDFFDDFGNEDAPQAIHDTWDWFSEEALPTFSVDSYQQSDAASPFPGPHDKDGWIEFEEVEDYLWIDDASRENPALTYDHAWDWDEVAEEIWQDEMVGANAKPADPSLAYADEWEWAAEDLPDDDWWAESTYQSVNAPAPLAGLGPHHEWDWDAEPLPDDEWWGESTYPSIDSVTSDAVLYIVLRAIAGAFTDGGGVSNEQAATATKSLLPGRHVPFLDSKGLVTEPWYRWMHAVEFQKLGGPTAPTVGDLSNSIQGVQSAVTQTTQAVVDVQDMTTQNAQALSTVVEVTKDNNLAGSEQIPTVRLNTRRQI